MAMTFEQVLEELRPVTRKQAESDSFDAPPPTITLDEARSRLEECENLMRAAVGNDWQYMREAGYAAYWTCIVNILTAAEIVGRDNLPDVQIPDVSGWIFLELPIEDLDFVGREFLAKAMVAQV